MCVSFSTPNDLLHTTFILGHGVSDGPGVPEKGAEGNMTAGKKKKKKGLQQLSLMVSVRKQGRWCNFKAA